MKVHFHMDVVKDAARHELFELLNDVPEHLKPSLKEFVAQVNQEPLDEGDDTPGIYLERWVDLDEVPRGEDLVIVIPDASEVRVSGRLLVMPREDISEGPHWDVYLEPFDAQGHEKEAVEVLISQGWQVVVEAKIP